ncbi:MAG: lipopolysaccharide biosynthesis protein [Methanosarcinales archaeon]|nr:lipopolysaccharide biosynthesis protein [Methanosarcinales archaeon]
MSLKTIILQGVLWVSLSTGSLKIINVIIGIILARLLEPEDFGLVALALITVNFFEMFRDLGIGSALIHNKNEEDIAADTAFFIFPVIGIVFYAISYSIAPTIADFFKEDELETIIRVLSLAFVIWSFGSLPRTLLIKDLKFKKMVIPKVLPKIGYAATAITMAFHGFGVWSLVFGRLVLEVLSVITIWHASDWRPSLKFNRKIAVMLFSFGKHVMIGAFIVFLISIVDITFIGRIWSSDILGYYIIALSISGLFTTQIAVILSEVLFPAFSMIQDNKEKLGCAYLSTMKYLSIVIFPAAFGLMTVAWYFIKVVYGDKWLPVVDVLEILCIYGVIRAMLKISENLYLAAGRPEIITRINCLQLILILILIYPLTFHYGILGTGISVTLPSIFILILGLVESGRIIDKSLLSIIKTILPGLCGSVIMVVVVLMLQNLISSYSPVLILILSIAMGSFSYFIFLWIAQKDKLEELKHIIAR